MAHAATERQISVSGNCTRRVAPDRGSIVLTAEFREKDLRSAAKQATEAYDRTVENVRRLGLENLELRTVEYSLGEVREWEKDRQVIKGFRARMGLEVATSSIQRLGEVIALAAREGLKDVGQLHTFMSEEVRLKEHFECLKTAAENARAKAEKLAAALKASVGAALTVTESPAEVPGPPRPVPMMAEMAADSRGIAPPRVEAGQQQISLVVNITFALK
jgi:uncharacterized protein YggE